MVQIIDDPNAGNIFGRVGAGFGRGLSEQLPKEIERTRLSSGLKKLAQSNETNPVNQIANLYGISGIRENPQIANSVLPYLQSQQLKEAARSNTQSMQTDSLVQNKEQPQIVPSKKSASGSNLAPKFNRESSNYLVPLPADQIDAQAVQLSDVKGIPFQKAQELIQRNDDKRLQAERAFEDRNTTGESEFNKYLETALQKAGKGIFTDTVGEQKNNYLSKVQQDISNGMSPRQAAQARSKELLDFAKVRQELRVSPTKFTWGTSGPEALSGLKSLRQSYEKAGQLETFANDLITYNGLSPDIADYLAYPPSTNKELNNFAEKTKARSSLNPFSGALIKGIKEKSPTGTIKRSEEQIGDFIAKHITDKDSIGTQLAVYNGRGYDKNKILGQVQKNVNEGKTTLNERQLRELGRRTPNRANMNDIFYFSKYGLDPLQVIE